MGVSKKNGTPKSSILIGFSIIFTIHFGGFSTPIFGNIHMASNIHCFSLRCNRKYKSQDLSRPLRIETEAMMETPSFLRRIHETWNHGGSENVKGGW